MQSIDYGQVTRLKPCPVKTNPHTLERCLAGEADRSEPWFRRYFIKAKLGHRFGIRTLGRRIPNHQLDRCSRPSNILLAAMPKHSKKLVPNGSGEITDRR